MKHLTSTFLLLLLMTTLVSAAPLGQVKAHLELTEDPLPFGKTAELVITLSLPDKLSVEFPEAKTLTIPDAYMLDQFSVDQGTDGELKTVTYHLLFTRFEPGLFQVGPVEIPTASGELSTEAITMDFAGAEVKEGETKEDIRGPKAAVEISTRDFWMNLAMWVGGVLLVLALLALIINYVGFFDRFRSPKKRALRKLKRISKSSRDGEELLLGAVDVLRNYLTEAYSLTTRERTSAEILRQMTMDNRCTPLKAISEEVLKSADQVKFARASVSNPEAQDLYAQLESSLRAEKKVAK